MIELRAGLLGYPVAHSRSPEVFAAWCAQAGVAGTYELLETPSAALAPTMARLWRAGWHGFNVTLPHKVAVARLLDADCQAVNCVVRGPGAWVGHDTDGLGFMQTLPLNPEHRRVALLGTGGAARSLSAALTAAGAHVRALSARSPASPADLDVDLLVNCTPLGMDGGPAVDWDALLPWRDLPDDAWVIDLVYAPEDTPLMQAARRRGLRTQGGLPMLRRQGELGYELWRSAAARS